jgi:hypothetical protein
MNSGDTRLNADSEYTDYLSKNHDNYRITRQISPFKVKIKL